MFIIGNIIGSIFWGGLIALLLTAAVWLLCQVLDRARSVWTYAVLLVFFLLAGAQCTMMVGTMYAKGYLTDIGEYANMLVSTGEDMAGSVSGNIDDISNILDQISEEYPIVTPIINKIDISDAQEYMAKGHTLVDFITDDIHDAMNYYILRRVLWTLGFMIVAAIAIIWLNKPTDYTYDINNLDEIY
jgi:predicted PurR-regulated permease PerM